MTIIGIICAVWGHKVMLKAFTGNVIKITHPLNMYPTDVPVYKWERQKHCIQCGKEVPSGPIAPPEEGV